MEIGIVLVVAVLAIAAGFWIRQLEVSSVDGVLRSIAERRGLHLEANSGAFEGGSCARGKIDGVLVEVRPTYRRRGRHRRWFVRVSAKLATQASARVEVRTRGVMDFVRAWIAEEVAIEPTFDAHAQVLSEDAVVARQCVDERVRHAFLAFPDSGVLAWDGDEVSLEWRGRPRDDVKIERAIEVVLAAARAAG